MERKLIIKLLEILEVHYPYSIRPEQLGMEMKAKESKISVEKIEPIINYLKQSGKIRVRNEGLTPERLGGAEEISILPQGIDYLTELKILRYKEISEKQQYNIAISVSTATVVLAIAAFLDVGINFILNWQHVWAQIGVLSLPLIAVILSFFLFMGWLILRSFTSIITKKNPN